MTSRVIARASRWGSVLLALAVLAACSQGTASEPPGMLLWSGDMETGDVSQFQKTPWNTVGGPPPKVVEQPVRSGRYAVELSLVGATAPDDGICCGSRNEIEPKFRDMVEGEDLWFGFSTYLDANFPTYYADFQTIMQFKQNFDGSPPLEMTVEEGEFRIEGGYGHPDGPRLFLEPVGHADKDRWIDWILHVKFSPDPTVGYVEVWRDGQLVLPRFAPPGGTLYVNPDDGSARSSVKTGYYRYRSIDSVGRIVFDEWRIGTSVDVVRPSPKNGPSAP
ncbi:polysaccharide lyase-like protein [Pseudonocardia hierapolitana]|uniref:Polysaccharide lyase-like protein n=1 Tax=Pseudonocardia hierapolitana TaxID=1128676 RepID=A0A561SVT5_9PSEU|nr:polysaccharide lyase [Pseudonocardia hierapolitana]TWF78972.1 polysaccharide lyase-like protein [Pseudonocardia hierapolitana]